jgi:hypothetical protein
MGIWRNNQAISHNLTSLMPLGCYSKDSGIFSSLLGRMGFDKVNDSEQSYMVNALICCTWMIVGSITLAGGSITSAIYGSGNHPTWSGFLAGGVPAAGGLAVLSLAANQLSKISKHRSR